MCGRHFQAQCLDVNKDKLGLDFQGKCNLLFYTKFYSSMFSHSLVWVFRYLCGRFIMYT